MDFCGKCGAPLNGGKYCAIFSGSLTLPEAWVYKKSYPN